MARNQTDDAFAFRDERVSLEPLDETHAYAVCAVPVPLPGQMVERATTAVNEGEPVEACAVVAARRSARNDGLWSWMPLAPNAKGIIGRLLFDELRCVGQWVGMNVTPAGEE